MSIESILDLRSEDFDAEKPEETRKIAYDLDGDGVKDEIVGRLWQRWARINGVVRFSSKREVSSNIACKRIGVLNTKTHGVNDLVCDQDKVLRWNGREYSEPEQ
jgi:hypothetical protein